MTRPDLNWIPNVWLTPEEDEPTHGLFLRLSDHNGMPTMKQMEVMTGLRLRHVRRGDGLQRLADLIRHDLVDLEARAYRKVSDKLAVFRDMPLGLIHDVDTDRRRVCIECLRTAPYHRFYWDLSFIDACHVHGCLLTDNCSCGNALSWNDGSIAKCVACETGSVFKCEPVPANSLLVACQTYLLSKFGVSTGVTQPVPGLDPLDVRDTVEVIGRVGALDLGGYASNWVEPADCGGLTPNEVRAHGYSILAHDRMQGVLDRVYAQFLERDERQSSGRRVQPRIDNAYGWFCHWFRYQGGETYCPTIAAELVRNAEQKFKVTSATFPLTPRSNDTVDLSEAAKICKTRPQTVRRFLAKEGLIREERIKGSPIRIQRSVIERMARDLEDSVNQGDLVALTGLRIRLVEKLTDANVIPCWLRGEGVEAKRFVFRRSEVLRWMHSLIPDGPTLETLPSDAMLLVDAPSQLRISTTDIVRMVADGQMVVIGLLQGRRDFAGAVVGVDHVPKHRESGDLTE